MAEFRANRSTILILGTLAVALLVVLVLLMAIWSQQGKYKAQAADLGPRIARMQGLTEHQEELRGAVHLSNQYLMDLTYTLDGDSQGVATAMQQQVRGVMDAAGLSVTGSQILPVTSEDEFSLIRLDVTAQGSLEALEIALGSLETQQPLVLIDSLTLQPVRTRARGDATQEVVARFRLVSLGVVL